MVSSPLEGIQHMLTVAPRGAFVSVDQEVYTGPSGIVTEWSIYVREDVSKTFIGLGESFEAALAEYYKEVQS